MLKILVCMLLVLNIAGCGGADTSATSQPQSPAEQTEYITSVPSSYFKASDRKGQVIVEHYPSTDYTNGEAITKTAYVYLPYGYDGTQRYNIFYLMHGLTMTAGSFFGDSNLVEMFDNMIAAGLIEPLIVVCATFDSQNQPQNFSRSTEELLVFHHDLRDNLMPYIEAKYSTYNSREQRAFGGFSLGAVTTWHQFIYNLDLVKYFLPMSGDCWIMGTYGGRYYPEETTEYLEGVVRNGGYSEEDFYIYEGIGTDDPIWTQTDNQIQAMMKTQTFTPRNLHYAIIEGGRHDLIACENYMFHGLQKFFGRK